MVSVLWLGACLLQPAGAAEAPVRLNQAGYRPNAPKIAVVVATLPVSAFTVREASTGKVAFTGIAGTPAREADSGDTVQVLDFSALNKPGRYFIESGGLAKSWQFTIAPDVYSRPFYLAMRSFYGQRCGMAVDLGAEFPGYKYEACHLAGAWHSSSGKQGAAPSSKGWHDAGDYGRYIVNSGITTGTLLWAWELYGSKLAKVDLRIPESGNKTPDMLDEIRWNLEWMQTLQDAADGGVWHKQTTERFSGFVMPEADKAPSVIIGTASEPFKSTCATADFAAVMAIAARAYKPFDARFADKSRKAAEAAWTWAVAHPAVVFNNPPGVATGGYGDRNCGDELLWASAELWRTTGLKPYHDYFAAHAREFMGTLRATEPQSWANVAPLALWAYALDKRGDAELAAAIRKAALAAADSIVARTAANPYRTSMTARDYIWGSNAVAANYGMQLLVANALQADPRYVETALDNLHYLLGRNTFSLSWVTQLGENPYRHPHHRPSGADKNAEPWPGLLSGGPNQRPQDPAMKKIPAGTPPARMFIDDQESYASNEIAINWNAPLVFLLAGVM
ncbi:MAG: glycoside hydrolase family 9 protein [Bryobacteraceae bacterium]|nr:glycoside hydrolase family 9 protein [Bryobacteraceae bacterium]